MIQKPYRKSRRERKAPKFGTAEQTVAHTFEMRKKQSERREAHGMRILGSTGEPKGPARLPSLAQINQERRKAAKKAKEETK